MHKMVNLERWTLVGGCHRLPDKFPIPLATLFSFTYTGGLLMNGRLVCYIIHWNVHVAYALFD